VSFYAYVHHLEVQLMFQYLCACPSSALGAAVNALKEAANAMNKIGQHTESDAAVKAFANARAEIEKCFEQYDVNLVFLSYPSRQGDD
jgi:hypothetical protein